MPHPTDRLVAWAGEALELGFDCIAEGDHAPFALVSEGGTNHLVEFKDASGNINPELANAGKDVVKQSFGDADLYAIVWDGYLTSDGKRQDAVFAEAGERGKHEAFVFAQLYHATNRAKPLKRIDEPILVSTAKHLLKPKSAKK